MSELLRLVDLCKYSRWISGHVDCFSCFRWFHSGFSNSLDTLHDEQAGDRSNALVAFYQSHIPLSALFYTRSRQYLRTFEYLREDLVQVVSALGACWPACPLHFCRRIPELYATPNYSATGTFGPKVAFSITVPLVHIPAALEGYTPRAGVIKPPWLTLYMTNKVGMTNSPLDVSR